MYENFSDEDTYELVYDYLSSTDKNIFILSDNLENIISFIIMKNNLCEDSRCFNCNDNICSYIILTCVSQEKRGIGIFKYFLKEVENYLKELNVDCIRLTAVNRSVFNIYRKIGFKSENIEDSTCEFKMIKYL
jgi:hypothetical protein